MYILFCLVMVFFCLASACLAFETTKRHSTHGHALLSSSSHTYSTLFRHQHHLRFTCDASSSHHTTPPHHHTSPHVTACVCSLFYLQELTHLRASWTPPPTIQRGHICASSAFSCFCVPKALAANSRQKFIDAPFSTVVLTSSFFFFLPCFFSSFLFFFILIRKTPTAEAPSTT